MREIRLVYCCKQRELSVTNDSYYNARPLTAAPSKQKFNLLGQKAHLHTSYGPDLSHCELLAFGPLKEALSVQRFNDDAEVQDYARKWLQTPSISSFGDIISFG